MAEQKHTPGPWFIGGAEPAGTWINASFHDEQHGAITGSVARAYSHMYMSPEEGDANARLILAAPDLLKGARLLMAYEQAMDSDDHIDAMQFYADAVDTLRAAIAKAIGSAA